MELQPTPHDELIVGETYWLDNEMEEKGIFIKITPQAAYFSGKSRYYDSDEDELIPLPYREGFIKYSLNETE